ncbi:hypothetical protein LOK49_LG11G00500 [Camellia lanceoleosa]|uniref:Uncharacterized protein n=1 Tax=Camellia lanceoleosa TaxID=1840588 RepID=A0ACC0G367_9ERIC|nr:hypothetical protein LOK49_LG11G00500 [Camellia lanceoleosa]
MLDELLKVKATSGGWPEVVAKVPLEITGGCRKVAGGQKGRRTVAVGLNGRMAKSLEVVDKGGWHSANVEGEFGKLMGQLLAVAAVVFLAATGFVLYFEGCFLVYKGQVTLKCFGDNI